MTDYISREAIAAEAQSLSTHLLNEWDTLGVLALIDRQPAADVRPVVRGKWLPDYDYTEYDWDGSTPLPEPRKFQDGWQCSLCGEYTPSETNYCPNCGADMRKES